MISANVRSVLRKYQMPVARTRAAVMRERVRLCCGKGVLPPEIDQRNPSMTPTMGLSEYKVRHFSGTIELLKPTGEM